MPQDEDMQNTNPAPATDDNLSPDEMEKAVDDLMTEFDLDEEQAAKLQQLEDEGYDEEDALGKVLDE